MGDLTQSQGDQGQNQGDQTESLGDLTQSQGNETQGDQTQGDQTQGDQTQSMTGHDGQIQGDQFLLNTPTISAPVTVSGLNLNLTVRCGNNEIAKGCGNCNDIIADFLRLLQLLAALDTAPANITFYGCCARQTVVEGALNGVVDNCLALIAPESGENLISVALDALDMVSVNITGTGPDLFSRLLAYLQSTDCSQVCCHCNETCRNCCEDKITSLLKASQNTGAFILFDTSCSQAEGYIYKLCNGIAYIADDPENPSEITAVPICRIKCWQAQGGVQ